jgi:DNA-binding transcriptional ArsR family regulator
MRTAEATEVFKALSVPSRMQIFQLLKHRGPLPVKDIAASLEMTPPAVSQHLKVLRSAGLVNAKRQGYWVPYAVDPDALSECCEMMVRLCSCPTCGSHAASVASGGEVDGLLERREKLLEELRRVESELEALRG